MSRKRAKNKRPDEAVPQEVDVLAEGSGPNEVIDASPASLAAAAEGLVEKRKGKRRKAKVENVDETPPEPEAEAAFDASASNVLPESDDEEEAALAEAEALTDEALIEQSILRAEAEAELGAAEAAGEGQIEGSVEDAVLRAEAEAELGTAEEAGAGVGAGGEEGDELGAALPTTAATMDSAQLKNLVEALVFASDKPVTLQRLRQLTRISDIKRLEQALAELATDYTNRGIALQQVSGGYQFRTNTQFSVWVQQLIAGRPVRLSRAQLETLAIVAYRQPITRPEIDEIRGVDSSATLRLLLDRSLIRTLGKKEDVGRPMLYGTTKEFLDFFSLSDLRELPTLREYSELTAESRKVMSDRLGVDADVEAGIADGVEGETAAAADEPAPEPSTDDVLAAYVAEGDAAMDAVAAVDSSARRGVEVDAWGQVIGGVDEDEPVTASSDEDSASGVEMASDDQGAATDIESASSDEEPVSGVEMVSSDEESGRSEEEPASRVEMASEDEESARSDEGSASGVESARPDEGSASGVESARSDDDSASGLEMASDDEVLASDVESASEDEEPSSGVEIASEDEELGAPAGGSIEDRLGLSSDEQLESVETASSDETTDEEAAMSVASSADAESSDVSSDDESSRS